MHSRAATGKLRPRSAAWGIVGVEHSAHLIGAMPPSAFGVMAALFMVGLAGSVAHCATMCGPLVLAQLPAMDGHPPGLGLVRGALIPYHLGRATTYTVLGGIAGGLGSSIAAATSLRPVLAGFLLLAAALFLVQALTGAGLLRVAVGDSGFAARLGSLVSRFSAPLLRRSDGGGYLLGVALGFLPCGLLYGALAAAAGTGSIAAGAGAMAAFAAATVPSLMVIGCVGAGMAGRWRGLARSLMAPLQAVSAVALVLLALAGPMGMAP
jgi:uncharacterized protein